MQIFTRKTRLPLLILLPFLASQLMSCAAILKGSESAVRVDAPPETKVYDAAGEELEQENTEGNQFEVFLPCDKDQKLTFRVGDREQTTIVKSNFQPAWLIPDLFLGVPMLVDLLHQSWYDFNNVRLLIPPDSLNYAVLPVHRIPERMTEDQRRLLAYLEENDRRTSDLGIYLAATSGWALGMGIPLVLTWNRDVSFDTSGDLITAGILLGGPLMTSAFIALVDSDADAKGDFGAAFGGAFLGSMSSIIVGSIAGVVVGSLTSRDAGIYTFYGAMLIVPPFVATRSYISSRSETLIMWPDSGADSGNARYSTLEGMQHSSMRYNFGDDAPRTDGFSLPLLNIKL